MSPGHSVSGHSVLGHSVFGACRLGAYCLSTRTSLGFIFCRAEQYIFIYFLNVGVQWMSGEWIVYCVEGVWWNLGGVSGGCNVNIFLLNNQLFLTKFFETFKPIYFCVCMYPSSHLNLVTPR